MATATLAPARGFRIRWAEVTACVAVSALAVGGALWTVDTLAERAAEPTVTLSESAMETCEYGSAMFYVARNIDPERAAEMATTDCLSYLDTNGQVWFNEYYGPQAP